MSEPAIRKNPSMIARLLDPSGERERLAREKARLEAFLSAIPGEYCGWMADGSAAYSPGFCRILGLESVKDISDIQACLSAGDAAALEGVFDRLQQEGTAFTIIVTSQNERKSLKICGSQGKDPEGGERFDILWVEDITEQVEVQNRSVEASRQKEDELQQFQAVLNAIPRPLWLRDSSQQILWCNATYADFLGLGTRKILEEQREIAAQSRKKKPGAKDEAQPGRALAAKALKEKTPQEARIHLIFEGNRLLMRINEIPLTPFEMTLGIAYNITREEELEAELKRYQSSTKELLEQLRTAIAIYDADQKLEFYNSAFAQLWGLEDGWLNTRPRLGEIMEKLRETRRLPEQTDFRRFKQSWIDMFTGLIEPHEDMLYLPDGSALRMLMIPHSMGGLMMTFEDVTSRLELESSYNTLIAVQKETLDNLAEAVSVYGGDGRLKLWNPSFGRLWDLNPEDLAGEPHVTKIVDKVGKFFTKEEWPGKREELVAKALDRLMHEGRLKRANDTLVDFTTVPLPDGGVLITYTDVTDTVRVENALREKNAALEAAERLKLDFLANVSYQLRTPLNAIMGFNEILGQEYFGPLNARQKDYTQDMKKASERLLSLINDILDLSTLEAGYMMLQREEVKVRPMMEAIFNLVGEWARKEKIDIRLKCPANIGTVVADQRRLQQAIINLIRNAITFTPSGGKIELSARRRKDGLEITVDDSGVGIPEEDRIRIFEPFERAQSGLKEGRPAKSGAGLGLSLVKNIIALHGGTIALDSEPGKGTKVTVFLPFASVETPLKVPVEKRS